MSRTKSISSSQSKHNVAGTLEWMAPELLKGKDYSEQSDIYALGMIIWEIVAKCTTPFEDVDDSLVCLYVINGGKETIPEDTPLNTQDIIKRCWENNPDERITLIKILEVIGVDESELLDAEKLSKTQDNNESWSKPTLIDSSSKFNSSATEHSKSLALDFTNLKAEDDKSEQIEIIAQQEIPPK